MSDWQVGGTIWTPEPWLPYQATNLLRQIVGASRLSKLPKLDSDFQVFEWGIGGSTLFWARLGIQRLISVEHQSDWFRAISDKLAEDGWHCNWRKMNFFQIVESERRIEVNLIPAEPGDIGPDPANPAHYKSKSTELGPCNFRAYASFIDQFGPFDLVLVDGMARASCLAHAAPKVKPGGWLVLDNTGDRPYYLEQTRPLCEGWERIDVTGYGPILEYQWTTTFFHNVRLKDYPEGRLRSGR